MYKYLYNINTPVDLKELSEKELDLLSNEIRKFLVKSVAKTGGHLAPNLGVVELTLALHYVFNSPKDKIVWDVGHQAYVHKIITGRRDRFDTLRQHGGLSGFPKKSESQYDVFDAGHSSNSISVGIGLATARDLKNENHSVISLIGDGALTGGMAFEALNHLGNLNKKMIVVLNDNEMSIDKNVGSISNYLTKLRTNRTYKKMKLEFENITNYIPKIGMEVFKTAEKLRDSVKYLITPGALFEEMGIKYFGPIDGHDIKELIDTFRQIKKLDCPVIVHVVTKKGKGYRFAEKEPDKYHGVAPFDIESGIVSSNKLTYSGVIGDKLIEMAKKDERVVAVSAAMPSGTGLSEFQKKFRNRFFDVGIAEGHAVTFSAGLATSNLKPYFAVYSTFLQRGYDQLVHDVGIQNIPVTLLIDRAGLVGDDGETHHGVFDISYLASIPNMTIMAPKDKYELERMLDYSLGMDSPLAIRYPRGEAAEINCDNSDLLKWEYILRGSDVAIFSTGNMVLNSIKVCEILKDQNINACLINSRVIKPFDEECIKRIAKEFEYVVTVEDNVKIGGFGSMINLELAKENYGGKILNIAIPDKFIEHGNVGVLNDKYGLSPLKISESILNNMNKERYVRG